MPAATALLATALAASRVITVAYRRRTRSLAAATMNHPGGCEGVVCALGPLRTARGVNSPAPAEGRPSIRDCAPGDVHISITGAAHIFLSIRECGTRRDLDLHKAIADAKPPLVEIQAATRG